MRLNQFQIDTINKLAGKHFGQETTVYLFGSSTDDNKKGRDIDLFINTTNEAVLLCIKHYQLITEIWEQTESFIKSRFKK